MWTATDVASPYRDIINWETSLQTAQLVWQKCMIVPWCCGWTAWISNLWPEELICNSNLAITTDKARLHNFPEANWATTQSTQMEQLKCRPYYEQRIYRYMKWNMAHLFFWCFHQAAMITSFYNWATAWLHDCWQIMGWTLSLHMILC